MSDCKKCREHMIEALYRELDPVHQDLFERHLAACPGCAAEHAGLAETLGLMARRERPDPGSGYWDGYWDRLSRRMLWEATGDDRRPSLAARISRLFARLPRWSYQAAGAAALVLVGILIGSRLLGPGGRPVTTASVTPGPASSGSPAVVQAGDFIERSKVLLLGLVNFDSAVEDAYALDLGSKQAVSRELLAAAPSIRNGLKEPGQRRLRDLVADLEVIMMQIANLESGQDLDGVELVKQGVDRTGIFLKIDLDRMTRDSRDAAGAGKPSGAAGPFKKSQV